MILQSIGVIGPQFTEFLHIVAASSLLLMCALNGDIAIRCGMPQQTVKVVNFDICKWLPKLIDYHSNVPRVTTK